MKRVYASHFSFLVASTFSGTTLPITFCTASEEVSAPCFAKTGTIWLAPAAALAARITGVSPFAAFTSA